MKIINGNDYYDYLQGMGCESIPFIREKENLHRLMGMHQIFNISIHNERWNTSLRSHTLQERGSGEIQTISPIKIFVGQKVYHGLYCRNNDTVLITYNKDEAFEFCKENFKRHYMLDYYVFGENENGVKFGIEEQCETGKDLATKNKICIAILAEDVPEIGKNPLKNLQKINVTSFTENYEFLINPPYLKNFHLHHILSADQAYQDIQMQLMNVNNPENNAVDINNENKIHKHGFNKASFRHR